MLKTTIQDLKLDSEKRSIIILYFLNISQFLYTLFYTFKVLCKRLVFPFLYSAYDNKYALHWTCMLPIVMVSIILIFIAIFSFV